jgi:hypothetical protein
MKSRKKNRDRAGTAVKPKELKSQIAQAQKRAEATRLQAQAAKVSFKSARKDFKKAKKLAKESRKKLKALKKALDKAARAARKRLATIRRKAATGAKPAVAESAAKSSLPETIGKKSAAPRAPRRTVLKQPDSAPGTTVVSPRPSSVVPMIEAVPSEETSAMSPTALFAQATPPPKPPAA